MVLLRRVLGVEVVHHWWHSMDEFSHVHVLTADIAKRYVLVVN